MRYWQNTEQKKTSGIPSGTTPSGDNAPATPSLSEGELSEDENLEEKYPNAKEYNSDAMISNSFDGDIFYVVVGGKKEYYKLLDRYQVTKFALGSAGSDAVWEKL
jgi:hypothetical protein